MKELLSGNEAIARGAFEAGASFAAAYPGTPSTEILESFARYPGVTAQWSPNEKVALEVGIGGSLAGARTLVAMKHVGVNVAADPLFTFSYTGVNAGLVLVSADDPGMHSSQNEQDNRHYARAAKLPMLEPSDSTEARDMTVLAFDLSEEFDTPVMLRSTTRISHSKGLLHLQERRDIQLKEYKKDPRKYVMVPAFGRMRHLEVLKRLEKLQAYAEATPLNRIEEGSDGGKIGIITSGVVYQYVREALPGASILKLGMPFPFPRQLVQKFAASVEKLYVIEELEPFLEDYVKTLGIPVEGKSLFPLFGEIDANMIAEKIVGAPLYEKLQPLDYDPAQIPMRPPVLCPGCTHRGVFYILKKLKLIVTGDIGCYTLAALPPLQAMDTCICMGASISSAVGMVRANPSLKNKVVAVIGDSTFFHSGLTGIVDSVYNKAPITVLILDNRITAMTGHQHHPGTGRTLQGEETTALEISEVVKGLGVKRVSLVDPFDTQTLEKVLKEELAAEEPSVVVMQRPCALLKQPDPPYACDEELCIDCGICLRLGCPAISKGEGHVQVDAALCTGCSLCGQICPKGALKEAGEKNA
jgi:indolepyruvate ferredoxin oxidoreductase, alpha subunit